MALVDYSYYITYLAGREAVVDSVSFPFFEQQAELYLDYVTHSQFVTADQTAVKNCICALCEVYSNESKSQISGRSIASESVGGHSISYGQSSSLSSFETQKKDIVRMYLWKYISLSRKVYPINEG